MDTPADPLQTDPSLLGKLCHVGSDAAAWALFVRRYHPVILAWARGHGLQSADAEDVCQSVLAGLAHTLPAFRYDPERGAFRGWLRTVLGNAVRNFWRGRARRPADVGAGDSDAAGLLREIEDPAGLDDLVTEIGSKFEDDYRLAVRIAEEVKGKVKEATWRAFELTTLQGMTGPAVAAELGIPVAYVYVYKDRVAKMLRQAMPQDTPPTNPEDRQ